MSEIKTIVATSADGLSRREFTLEACLAILSGVVITISEGACGGGSSYSATGPSSNPPTASNGDVNGVISNNHGHVATITAADLSAGNAITINIQGSATHNHTVALSANQMATIAAHQQVAVTSSTTQAHNHTVTFD